MKPTKWGVAALNGHRVARKTTICRQLKRFPIRFRQRWLTLRVHAITGGHGILIFSAKRVTGIKHFHFCRWNRTRHRFTESLFCYFTQGILMKSNLHKYGFSDVTILHFVFVYRWTALEHHYSTHIWFYSIQTELCHLGTFIFRDYRWWKYRLPIGLRRCAMNIWVLACPIFLMINSSLIEPSTLLRRATSVKWNGSSLSFTTANWMLGWACLNKLRPIFE